MSYRIHTANRRHLAVYYLEHPEVYFDDDEMAVGPSLVLDDCGSQEAFVIPGTRDDIIALARKIHGAADPTAQAARRLVTALQGWAPGDDVDQDGTVRELAEQLAREVLGQ